MNIHRRLPVTLLVSGLGALAYATPSYVIYDLGVATASPADSASQGFSISGNGTATGRSLGTGTRAYSWTLGGGTVTLSNLSSPVRNFGVGNGVNNLGTVVGTGATTAFGSNRLPLIWQGGTASQLPLPSGQTGGDAWDVNDANMAVGSAGSGINQRGVIYQGGTGTVISATTSNGSYFVVAYGVNNSGMVVGNGWDPSNAAVTVGMVYNSSTGISSSVGALTSLGHNSAIAFGVSDNGYVTGTSSLNGGSDSRAYRWSAGGGITEVPLVAGASTAQGRGINSNGWVVGTGSGSFAVPFLYDGTQTYRLQDLIGSGTGWDLSTNTSSSAMGISEGGYIVGTGVHNGLTRAYVMVPVPEPASLTALSLGALALMRKRKKS